MKFNIFYTLLIVIFSLSNIQAQLDCNNNIIVDLDSDGEGEIIAGDLVANLEFMLSQGTVNYYIFPGNTGEFTSVDDVIPVDCNNAGFPSYIVEVTSNGDLLYNCSGEYTVLNNNGGCEGINIPVCGQNGVDCTTAIDYYVAIDGIDEIVPAESFALCSSSDECTGTYQVAYGQLLDSGTLTYSPTISTADSDGFANPVVVNYIGTDTMAYAQAYLYVWDLGDCIFYGYNNVEVSLSASASATLTPDMFLVDEAFTCTGVTMGITTENGPEPTEYLTSIEVGCDELGVSDIYIKNEENELSLISSVTLVDPLEACGSALGDGDELISCNTMPLGTVEKTDVIVNGIILPKHPAGTGWIINEDNLIDGENTINFVSDKFTLNGVSTLDLVLGLRIILNDIWDDPSEVVVFDIDQSGYNGINDLIQMRSLILGQQDGTGFPEAFFIHEDYVFPADFNPFNFENNFTQFTFDKADYASFDFAFDAHKVGDVNNTAITGLQGEKVEDVSSRSVASYAVSDIEVVDGEEFTFALTYESETKFKGLLAALVSDGIEFLDLTSEETGVEFNIMNDSEIRVSYLSADLVAQLNKITFNISAKASKDGNLIDLLGLKAGFPQEVVDENNETIIIDDLTTYLVLSANDSGPGLDVNLYPNPVNDALYIKAEDLIINELSIYSIEGQIAHRNINANQNRIDISNYPSGMYILNIVTNKGAEKISFVKE